DIDRPCRAGAADPLVGHAPCPAHSAARTARSVAAGRRRRLLLRGGRADLWMRGRHHQEPRRPRARRAVCDDRGRADTGALDRGSLGAPRDPRGARRRRCRTGPGRPHQVTAREGAGTMSSEPGSTAAADADASPDAAATSPRRRTLAFAAQELRLISALVVLIAVGLFLALPFVLSIGSVVFLPLVTAIVLTIVLSPLADRMAQVGLPNFLASFFALLVFLAIVSLALTAVLRPAVSLCDDVPAMIDRIGQHFQNLQGALVWVSRLNEQIAGIVGSPEGQQVVLAGPAMLEQVAFATPTVVLEVLLTFLMAFFMIEARVRMGRCLLLVRQQFGARLKAARVMRAVQYRVAAYILTVRLINLGVGIIVTLGAWALGMPP